MPPPHPKPKFSNDLMVPVATGAVLGGALLWVIFAFSLHAALGVVGYFVADAREKDDPDKGPDIEFVEVEFPEEEEVVEEEVVEEEVVEEEIVEEEIVEEEIVEEEIVEEEVVEEEVVEEEEIEQDKKEPEEVAETQEAPDDVETNDEFDDFTDFGAFEGSTSGVGTVEVAQGSSAKGRLRKGSTERKTGSGKAKNSDTNAKKVEPPKPEKPKVVSRRKLDTQAEPNERHNRRLKASYPAALKKAGLEADVVAVVTVRANGTVANVKIVSDVDQRFADAAKKVIKKFKFSAATRNGEPVASELRLVYRFRLDDA